MFSPDSGVGGDGITNAKVLFFPHGSRKQHVTLFYNGTPLANPLTANASGPGAILRRLTDGNHAFTRPIRGEHDQ